MTVDTYLSAAPEPQRSTLRALREVLRRILPRRRGAISYGVPAFTVDGKAVAGYAHAKRHSSYFPLSGSVLAARADGLHGYDWTKGRLRFPEDDPLPEPLVRRLVEVRMGRLSLPG
jgi:uncharacterized protein YdhG (YjbR/CyaY superfamily)